MKIWEIHIPECDAEGLYGNIINLTEDGTLSINRYDGMTLLNSENARKLAKILMEYAELRDKNNA